MNNLLQDRFQKAREDFPAIAQSKNIYFDSAATAHKPFVVINTLADFYRSKYGTVHRAVYSQALYATDQYNGARAKIAKFINSCSPSEVIFTKGTTDSINIIADSCSQSILKPSSRILVSEMEHHSNLIPWQIAARRSGASLELIPITPDGALDLDALQVSLSKGNVTIIAVTHCSNALGTINPIQTLSKMAHAHDAYVFVDGAQAASHLPLDMQALGCDAYAFSAHKMYGPTGIGVLWAREGLLEILPPTRGGGDMIDTVTFSESTWADLPLKFEPGTPPIAEAIGFGAAIDYLTTLSLPAIYEYEQALSSRLTATLGSIPKLQLIGTAQPRGALQAFHIPGVHPLDIATLLDLEGIAVRSGHLCCQPLLNLFSLTAVTRASLCFYNTFEEIDRFGEALQRAAKRLRP
jgi:cysteine desulfurase / selenocysteine lyase